MRYAQRVSVPKESKELFAMVFSRTSVPEVAVVLKPRACNAMQALTKKRVQDYELSRLRSAFACQFSRLKC